MASAALKKKLERVYELLLNRYGPQKCFLNHQTPFELLVATILSAQCTDKRVNLVTEKLFKTASTPAAFAEMSPALLEEKIRSCGYYHAKAKNIIGASKAICERFHGEVPSTMEELTSLPGVGRKTANVVLADSFGVPGLPVDTHVTRITNLLGVVKTSDAVKIEAILCGGLSPEKWGQISHLLIVLGRELCPAGHPHCMECPLAGLCAHGKKENRK